MFKSMAFFLLLSIVGVVSAKGPSCQFTLPKVYVNEEARRFCLGFVPGYLDRMKSDSHEITFKGTHASPSVTLKYSNETMRLFLVAQAALESGWANQKSRNFSNYWGLGGNYTKPDGTNTFRYYKSFDDGYSFLMNHCTYGINASGSNNRYHPGWPNFVKLLSADEKAITSEAINRAMNSGPYCRQYPAYNTDRLQSCAGRQDCPCIDYGGKILKSGISQVINSCLAVYNELEVKGLPRTLNNFIQRKASFNENVELIEAARDALMNYAQTRLKSTYCR